MSRPATVRPPLIRPEHCPKWKVTPTDLDEAAARLEVLRGRLVQRRWGGTTAWLIPSVLKSADCLMVWLAEQPDPGRSRAVALLAELTVLRRDFRREI
jgi:hypothetical protein